MSTHSTSSQIPWTRELRRIPEIARSHHEKLDGSGYPLGKRSSEIALETRMMTIADIFDALTATDRPYKAAVPVEAALDILGHEATSGALDPVLLEMFIDLRPWRRERLSLYPWRGVLKREPQPRRGEADTEVPAR